MTYYTFLKNIENTDLEKYIIFLRSVSLFFHQNVTNFVTDPRMNLDDEWY